jgi:hypothetical protein
MILTIFKKQRFIYQFDSLKYYIERIKPQRLFNSYNFNFWPSGLFALVPREEQERHTEKLGYKIFIFFHQGN